MFNTFEYVFVCQSLLKERRPPTGGLREALKGVIGRKGFHDLVPLCEVETTPGALLLDFPPPGENNIYCLEWIDPHRGVSCRSLLVVGAV